MALIHDPIPCNYAHSMFVFDLAGVRVTKQNYEQTFGSKPLKNLRKACRDELHKAILKKQIQL